MSEAEQSKYSNPVLMQAVKSLLGKTETEIYLMEGGVPEELVQAHERDLRVVTGEVLSTTDEPRTGPRSEVQGSGVPQVGQELEGSQIKETIAAKSLLELEDLIEKLEQIKESSSADMKKRWEAYSLRIQGYSVSQIAEQFNVSVQLIYAYWDWCTKQLPDIAEHIAEFTTLSVQRLEAQYRQLAIARAKGDILAHKVSLDIIDQQGKLLGVHKVNVQLDSRVTYVLEGVDMDKL